MYFFSFRRALEKQAKTMEDQRVKQIKAIQNRVVKLFLDTNQKSIVSLFSKHF